MEEGFYESPNTGRTFFSFKSCFIVYMLHMKTLSKKTTNNKQLAFRLGGLEWSENQEHYVYRSL